MRIDYGRQGTQNLPAKRGCDRLLNTMSYDVTVGLRLPSDLGRALRAMAQDEGVSLSDLARRAIEAHTWGHRMQHFQEYISEDQPFEWVETALQKQLRIAEDHAKAAERLQRALRKQIRELQESRQQVTTEAVGKALKGVRQAQEQPELVE
jgi:hypothetical protein